MTLTGMRMGLRTRYSVAMKKIEEEFFLLFIMEKGKLVRYVYTGACSSHL
jgi:hypothetical protein